MRSVAEKGHNKQNNLFKKEAAEIWNGCHNSLLGRSEGRGGRRENRKGEVTG
jgi:hypothetical protein